MHTKRKTSPRQIAAGPPAGAAPAAASGARAAALRRPRGGTARAGGRGGGEPGTGAPTDAPWQSEKHLLWERPGFLLRRLNQIHYALFFEHCQAYGVTPVQYGLLTVLAHAGEAMDITALCAEVGVDRTTVADVTRRLTERGLVSQHRSLLDGRQKLTRITQAGLDVTAASFVDMKAAQAAMLAPLPPAERRAFLKSMARLVAAHNDLGHTPVKAFA
ncbi:MarR family winged helix-turn-helix transcriptional regulator [Chitinasiproducens palmae]|uniref:DNA-binding transcriptional regulator, MarR family n=1 Tax=Chitinasiproducens palmae TaxID=1770053 RepID=A0A1H2PK60_9BURK|nr:MarR family winged helix-turn-helix transcriptional regulator [Chitinasiproducens palmae]SDV46824.1 DNA-binding transcriptional regulator, MarR family [Chitinasiproducens palmae]